MPQYNSVYLNKINDKKKGSRVAMYIHDSIDFNTNETMYKCNSDIESLFISINSTEIPIHIGTVYRPPSGDLKKFFYEFKNLLSSFDKKDKVMIMGDFNINMFNDNKHRTSFEETILCNGFTPTISVATHMKPKCLFSCIDNILVNNPENVTASGVIDTHISHHRSLFLSINCQEVNKTVNNNTNSSKMNFDFSNEKLSCLSKLLEKRLNSENYSCNGFQGFMGVFTNSIEETCKLTDGKYTKRNRIANP